MTLVHVKLTDSSPGGKKPLCTLRTPACESDHIRAHSLSADAPSLSQRHLSGHDAVASSAFTDKKIPLSNVLDE